MADVEQDSLDREEIGIDLESADIRNERIGALRDLLPEAFVDNVFNPERAAQALGIDLDRVENRYGLSWAGKQQAFEALRQRSVATLRPNRDLSSDFETARHLLSGSRVESRF